MWETWVLSLGWEDSLEKGSATHSVLENSMDRGAWQATVHGATKSQDTTEQLSLDFLGLTHSLTRLLLLLKYRFSELTWTLTLQEA